MISVLRRGRKGLTLIEVMVSAGLFTIATLGLMSAWPLQGRAVDSGRDVVMATSIAEREMESAFSQGYSTPARTVDETNTAWVNGAKVLTTYHTQTTVSSPSANLTDVVVQVTWTDGGVTHAVSLESLIASPQ